MTKISIPTKIDIPDNIEVRLIREDTLETSNIFRIMFEITLALFGGVFGFFLTNKEFSFIHYFLFFLLLISCAVFLILTNRYLKKSKVKELSPDSRPDAFPIRISGFLANIRNENVEKVKGILEIHSIPIQNTFWHSNTIKTEYSTLRISGLNNHLLMSILNSFKKDNIDFIDEKILI
jgi:hypothetical protein